VKLQKKLQEIGYVKVGVPGVGNAYDQGELQTTFGH
jgi:hypothetical protein